MAVKVQRINPLDLQPRKAIGVALPFSGRAVFNSTYLSKDAIRSNLINYFLTGKNERYFNNDFGAGLRNILFSQVDEDTFAQIRSNILRDLEIFFPRVVVTTLEIQGDPDSNTVTFFMKYAISDTNIEDEIAINFEN